LCNRAAFERLILAFRAFLPGGGGPPQTESRSPNCTSVPNAMPFQLDVYALPDYVSPEDLEGGVAVVIDVLRASTSIVHALEADAKDVLPCVDVDEARRLHAALRAEGALLTGERNALPLEGFDLGNSPDAFTPEAVRGRSVVMTTTNGTRALARCRRAKRIFVGSFVNAAAVVRAVSESERIQLICAGTVGEITREDVLLAGLLVDRLLRLGDKTYQLNAQAATALEGWRHVLPAPCAADPTGAVIPELARVLRTTLGGSRVIRAGCEDDIDAAARLDRFSCVPELLPGDFRIVPSRSG